MTLVMTKTKTSFLHLTREAFQTLREDPLEKDYKDRFREAPEIPSTVPLGKRILAKLLFCNRFKILGLSLEKFSNLINEDYRRSQMFQLAKQLDENGKSFDQNRGFYFESLEAYNQRSYVSNSTLSRIERAEGPAGANIKTISFLAERLVNPVTEDFFTQSELILLSQGFESPEVNPQATLDLVENLISESGKGTGDYVTLTRSLNRKKSESLLYRPELHSF